MKKTASVFVFMLVFSVSNVMASKALTLDMALEIVKSQNLEIKSAELELESSKEDIQTAQGNHWGKVDFIQDFARTNDAGNSFGFKLTSREANFGDFGAQEFMNNFMAGTPDYTTPPHNLNYPDDQSFFQSKLKYEVPLFTGFQITGYVEIMKAMSKMKSLQKHQVIDEKIYQVKKTFYDMGLLRNSTRLLHTILNNIQTLEITTKEMINEGYAKKVDLLEVQAKKGNVQRLILQMESNQKLLYHYLSFLLNQKVDNIDTPSISVSMIKCKDEDIIKNNLDIKRAMMGLKVRKNMVVVSKSSFYPMAGAFAEIATADDTFLGDADDHKAYTIGARITWNLFNGGIDRANLEKARLQHLKTKTQVQLAKKGIALKVDQIKTEIKTYDAEIESLEKELILADEIYSNYEGRYREQLVSMSDVIIKQSQQIEKILQLQMVQNKRNERVFALEKIANGEYK